MIDKFESSSAAWGGSNNSIGKELQNRCSSDRASKLVANLILKQKESVRRSGF